MSGSFEGVIRFAPGQRALTLPAVNSGRQSLPVRDAIPKRSMSPAELKLFEQTFLPYTSAAYNLARWITGNDQDAQDVVQEAFLRAVRFFGGFRGDNSKAWFLTIVRNTACSSLQRSHGPDLMTSLDPEIHDVEDGSPDPETDLLRSVAAEEIRSALERLPIEFREVIILRELEGLSYKEIADVAGVPMGTVMSRLARARRRLRQILIDRGAKED